MKSMPVSTLAIVLALTAPGLSPHQALAQGSVKKAGAPNLSPLSGVTAAGHIDLDIKSDALNSALFLVPPIEETLRTPTAAGEVPTELKPVDLPKFSPDKTNPAPGIAPEKIQTVQEARAGFQKNTAGNAAVEAVTNPASRKDSPSLEAALERLADGSQSSTLAQSGPSPADGRNDLSHKEIIAIIRGLNTFADQSEGIPQRRVAAYTAYYKRAHEYLDLSKSLGVLNLTRAELKHLIRKTEYLPWKAAYEKDLRRNTELKRDLEEKLGQLKDELGQSALSRLAEVRKILEKIEAAQTNGPFDSAWQDALKSAHAQMRQLHRVNAGRKVVENDPSVSAQFVSIFHELKKIPGMKNFKSPKLLGDHVIKHSQELGINWKKDPLEAAAIYMVDANELVAAPQWQAFRFIELGGAVHRVDRLSGQDAVYLGDNLLSYMGARIETPGGRMRFLYLMANKGKFSPEETLRIRKGIRDIQKQAPGERLPRYIRVWVEGN